MTAARRDLGAAGERVATLFLRRHGLAILAHNVAVGRGEVDIVARDGPERVVVEVRCITGPHEPLAAFDRAKEEQVRRLARRIGADRVDLVALRVGVDAAEIRWVRGVA